ncbi:MAG: hypothetical protein QNK04_27220 [Myxococcota bacterium]|nr:hypothetical protein [Myxococcota bacterium]
MPQLRNVRVIYAATAYVIAMAVYGFFAGSWSPTATEGRLAAETLRNLDESCFASNRPANEPIPTRCEEESDLLSLEAALEHLRQLSSSRRGSWQAYFAVVIGALGFIAARPRSLATNAMTLGVSLTFAIFAVSNLGNLTKLQAESIRVAEYLCSLTYCEGDSEAAIHSIVRSMRPYSPYQVWVFHLLFDWFALVLFWNIPSRNDDATAA